MAAQYQNWKDNLFRDRVQDFICTLFGSVQKYKVSTSSLSFPSNSKHSTELRRHRNGRGNGENIPSSATKDEEKREPVQEQQTGALVGGVLGTIIFIGIIIGIVFLIRKYQQDTEGPPKHKPPPPVKAGSSTEMLNKPSEPPTATETVPLSPGEVYYEPTGGEPVTMLDEDATDALNGGAPPVLNKDGSDGHHGNDSSNHGPSSGNIPRGESFVSTPMYV